MKQQPKLNYTVTTNEFGKLQFFLPNIRWLEKLNMQNYMTTQTYPSSVQTTSDNWMQ